MERKFFLLLLFIAAVLRLTLASVNQEAYDNHFRVIVALVEGTPRIGPIAEYHPKLFHHTAAAVIKGFGTQGARARYVLVQWLVALFGLATVLVLWLFLGELKIPSAPKLLAFGFCALNPALIGMNAQVMNDTFAIFFVTAATFFFVRYLKANSNRNFAGLAVCSLCALGSKANGGIAIALFFVVMIFSSFRTHSRRLRAHAAILLVASTILMYYGGVFGHGTYRRFVFSNDVVQGKYWGDTVKVPWHSEQGLSLMGKGFLRFHPIDLLVNPHNDARRSMILPSGIVYPYNHMSSYWSQVYGNSVSSRFHDWPPSWQNRREGPYFITRALLILNLIPLLLTFGGIGVKAWAYYKGKSDEFFEGETPLIALAMALLYFGYIAGGARYYMMFPIHQFAKFSYLLPLLPALAYGLCSGYGFVEKRTPKMVVKGAAFGIIAIFVFDVLDIAFLIAALA